MSILYLLKDKIKIYRFELLSVVVVLLLSSIQFYFSALRYSTDDQYILFRYIDNIASGQGFVYNLGEKILGSTTPLFTLIGALIKFIFNSVPTSDLVAYTNIAFLSLSAFFFYGLSRLFLNRSLSLTAVLIFGLSLSRTIAEGMESPLFILILLSSIYFFFKEKNVTSSISLALLVLTRPDAVVVMLPVVWFWWKKLGLQITLRLISIFVLVMLPWLIFATIYFGSFIPQTIITKMHTEDIVMQSPLQALKVQLSDLSRIYWGKIFDPENIPLQVIFNLLPFLYLVYLSVKKNWNSEKLIPVIILFLYFLLFSLSNPVMFPWYLSQLAPLWILVSFVGFSTIFYKTNNKNLKLILMVLILIGPLYFWSTRTTSQDKGTDWNSAKANYIKKHMSPGETIGVNNIGLIGYHTGAYIVDFFGLTNDYAYAFYPIEDKCIDKTRQYSVPPNLIFFAEPDWIVLSGEGEMGSCLHQTRWFKRNYENIETKEIDKNTLWHKKTRI